MRKCFIAVLFILAATTLKAQMGGNVPEELDYSSTVLFFERPNVKESVKPKVQDMYKEVTRKTPQQVGVPKFIFSDKSGKATFTIGGFVNYRMAYDFNNAINNRDFVTFDIPMQKTANDKHFLMDASTSRLYFRGMFFGLGGKPLEAYIESDFRGSGNSFHLREAYVSWNGITAGQTVTTFCDLAAGPNTIDFEGPNAYTYGRNLMLQYKHAFKNGFSFAVALEDPSLSATYAPETGSLYQRVPDIPAYVQYSWNKSKSHIRASGIYRNLTYEDKTRDKAVNVTGWGTQLSGCLYMNKIVSLSGQIVYGKGLSAYIADLQGNGYSLMPEMNMNNRLFAPEVLSWFASTQINLTPKMPMTFVYSQVRLPGKTKDFAAADYKYSQYILANIFYNFNSWVNVGLEYIYGTRENFDNAKGHSNRIQTAVQVNF